MIGKNIKFIDFNNCKHIKEYVSTHTVVINNENIKFVKYTSTIDIKYINGIIIGSNNTKDGNLVYSIELDLPENKYISKTEAEINQHLVSLEKYINSAKPIDDYIFIPPDQDEHQYVLAAGITINRILN